MQSSIEIWPKAWTGTLLLSKELNQFQYTQWSTTLPYKGMWNISVHYCAMLRERGKVEKKCVAL